MKFLILIAFAFLTTNISLAQKHATQIEINPYMRYDAYPEFFESSYPLYDIYVTPKGTSHGLNINLKKTVHKNYKILIGLGYYRNTINKIKSRNTGFPGERNDRSINFLSPLFIPFYTDKYCYHSIALNIGVQRDFMLKNNFILSIDGMLSNFFTFSQYYHLTYNPEGSVDYKKSAFKYSGLSAMVEVSLQKRINRISVGPKLIIPAYTNWKTDETLIDVSSKGSRDKWLKGFGLGISFNYSLNSKK